MAESKPLALLEEQVKCAVCLDTYNKPKILPCQHYFCENCILLLAKGQNQIVCPTCRTTTNSVIADLPTAFFINNVIELYNASKSSTHNCPRHDRALDMYCSSCKQLVCAKCAVKEHKAHDIDMLADCLEEHRKEIETYLLLIKQQQSGTKTIINDLVRREKEIREQGQTVKRDIEQFIDTIHKQLNKKVDAIVQEKEAKIRKQRSEAENELAILETCIKSVKDRLKGGAQQVILHKQDIIDTIVTTADQVANMEHLRPREMADITFNPPEIQGIEKSIKVGGETWNTVPFNASPSVTKMSRAIKIVNPETKEEVEIFPVLPKKCMIKNRIAIATPKEIALAPDGTLVVSQDNSRYITIMNHDEHYTIPCAANVSGLAVTSDECILVVDNTHNCISKYTRRDGQLVDKAGADRGLNQFERPQGITVDSTGRIYVCDTGKHRVAVLKPSNMKVAHQLDVRRKYMPTDVGINSKGIVYVCDGYSQTILHINNDTHRCIGSEVLKRPSRIAIGANDIMYVTDIEKQQVLMFDSDDKCLGSIKGEGDRPKQFQQLEGIAANRDGDIFICDVLESAIYNYHYDYNII